MGQTLASTLKNLFTRTLDHLAARDCCLCGRVAEPESGPVCAACTRELPRHDAPACPRCALPTSRGEYCDRCLSAPPAYDATRAVFSYAFPLDVLVQALKYRHRLALAGFFAREMETLPPVDLVLPMPLHPHRLRMRGFNQAVEIARPLARAAGLPLELTGVARVLDTVSQATLDHDARLANLRDAFACRRRFDDLRVAVIDDVMTTGASLEALARCLKAGGAAAVHNLVVARTGHFG